MSPDSNIKPNLVKLNCGNEEVVFLANAIKEGRSRRILQMYKTTEDVCVHFVILKQEEHISPRSSNHSDPKDTVRHFRRPRKAKKHHT